MKRQLLLSMAFMGAAFMAMPASAADRAGILAAVDGKVTVERGGKRLAGKSGMAVFEGDRIAAAAKRGFQILLLDETVLTLSRDGAMALDRFRFDPANGSGRLHITQTAGVLKFATGQIPDGTPETFRISLPGGASVSAAGRIGQAVVMTSEQARRQFPNRFPELQAPAPKSATVKPVVLASLPGAGPFMEVAQAGAPIVFAALVGPGPLTQTNANTGSFNFSTPNGSVDLNRPGGAVLATSGRPPVFFIAPPGSIQTVSQGVAGGSNDGGSDGADDSGGGSDQSGSGQGGTDIGDAGDTGDTGDGGSLFSTSDGQGDPTGQPGGGDPFIPDNVTDGSDLGTGTTPFGGTLQELVSVNSGSVSGGGNYTGTITGNFDFLINFANRTFDMQSYNLNGGGLNNDSIDIVGGSANLPSDSRTSLTVGNNGEDFPATVSGGCGNCSVTATFPSGSSIQATVTNGASSGSTGPIGF